MILTASFVVDDGWTVSGQIVTRSYLSGAVGSPVAVAAWEDGFVSSAREQGFKGYIPLRRGSLGPWVAWVTCFQSVAPTSPEGTKS